ncbi:MotE family protein [Solibacillus sp. CAU 1738]|uniref:MotE family protein n=1 Tax=Solibacillus sp. CAU 1738 TaxID=3140363 RepID=UPI0032608EE6
MVKNKVENINIEETSEKGPGIFQKLFFWVLIPLLFTLTIFLIIAQFTNTNVFQFADGIKDKVPFLQSNDTEIIEDSSLNEQKVVTLQAQIQEKEAEISQLQTKISSSNEEVEALLAEQERLLFEIEKLKRDQEQTTKDFKDILSTFEKMPAKTAAPILVKMSDDEALRILSSMKPDTLSAIFTKMSPTDAARYTELLAKN